jgi:hypothetical protein
MITIRPQVLLLETRDKLWGPGTTLSWAPVVPLGPGLVHRTATYNFRKSVYGGGLFPVVHRSSPTTNN